MALITPTGIAADFTVTRTTNNAIIWSVENGTGTLNSGGMNGVIRLFGNGNEYELCRFGWSVSGGDSNWKPNFSDRNPPLRDYGDLPTDFAGKSFYVWLPDDSTLHTFVIDDNDGFDGNEIYWRTGSGNHGEHLPATFGNGDTARIIVADDNQATVVSNFVQGLETPDAAFTSA